MGRKGGGKKAFLKGVVAKPETAEASAEPSEDTEPSALDTAFDAQPHSAAAHDTRETTGHDALPTDAQTLTDQQLETESRGQLTQRQKKETKTMKETVKRLGKKKKDEAAKLEDDMEDRHAQELTALEQREKDAAGPEEDKTSILNTDLYSFSLPPAETQKNKQLSRAQKRRNQQAEKEADREAELAAERDQQGESEKSAEARQLREMLTPLGLTIREIQPDGHCMYRAVEDQLEVHSNNGANGAHYYTDLRQKTANYMRSHKDELLPFIIQDLDEDNLDNSFESYCQDVAKTAAWGGQAELNALANVLHQHIKVYAVGLPVVDMGKQYQGDSKHSLTVCYLRHAFGLGEHYNSVIPEEAQTDSDESDGFETVTNEA